MMSPRQRRFYVWTVDVWRQADTLTGVDFGKYTLHTASVPCLYASKRERIRHERYAHEMGAREPALTPLDRFDFVLGTDVRDTDVLHLVGGPASGDLGRWFAIIGTPSNAPYRANRVRALAKATLKPDGA